MSDARTGRGAPEVMATHTPALFAAAVERAVALLRAGEVVVLPTETVYGLAANALDAEAVARVYAAKGRPAANPLIVHVAEGGMARACVSAWPAEATQLASAFWPGPLTLVLPKAPTIPDVVTAGGGTVAIRWPSHPLMQAVIRGCGFPLAAPSANLANAISPTSVGHVVQGLGGRVALVVDGGPCVVGIESTVVDVTVRPARVLRPGMIHSESLAAVLGEVTEAAGGEGIVRSPGLMERHYAPRARLRVCRWGSDAELARLVAELGADPAEVHVVVHDCVPSIGHLARVCLIPHEPEAYARAMYAEWHRCDELGARWILVEAVPSGPEWRGIADRLRRASAAA